MVAYGATEMSLISMLVEPRKGSCGKPPPYLQWKVIIRSKSLLFF